MKLFTMILLSVFLGKSCASQNKNDMKTATIEYTANTRGFYQKISIQNQLVSISKDRNEVEMPEGKKISDADWKEVTNCFEVIALDSLATLKAPTQKRLYDGAAIANLKITIGDKVYESSSFDHGFPPAEIKKLVNKINSFAKTE